MVEPLRDRKKIVLKSQGAALGEAGWKRSSFFTCLPRAHPLEKKVEKARSPGWPMYGIKGFLEQWLCLFVIVIGHHIHMVGLWDLEAEPDTVILFCRCESYGFWESWNGSVKSLSLHSFRVNAYSKFKWNNQVIYSPNKDIMREYRDRINYPPKPVINQDHLKQRCITTLLLKSVSAFI